MAQKAPGKADREGVTMVQLYDMFPTEESAREWFEARVWPDGRHCPRCGSVRTHDASHNDMPYRCSRLPRLLLGQDRNCHGRLASLPAQVGIRDLPAFDQSQGRVQHETFIAT